LSFSFLVVKLMVIAFLLNKVLVTTFIHLAMFKDTFYFEEVAAIGVR